MPVDQRLLAQLLAVTPHGGAMMPPPGVVSPTLMPPNPSAAMGMGGGYRFMGGPSGPNAPMMPGAEAGYDPNAYFKTLQAGTGGVAAPRTPLAPPAAAAPPAADPLTTALVKRNQQRRQVRTAPKRQEGTMAGRTLSPLPIRPSVPTTPVG